MGIIRLLLALAVVAAHTKGIFGLTLVGGKVAVQSFFIISGFYMSLILNEKYIGPNRSYGLFISNRLIRLYPIYWTVLIATLVSVGLIAFITKGHSTPRFETYLYVHWNFYSLLYLVVTNIVIFGQDLIMFMGIVPENGHFFYTSNYSLTNPPLHSCLFIPQAWTLGLEIAFYLVAPFILRRNLKIVITLIMLSFLLRGYMFNVLGLREDPWIYRFFPTEIMFFLWGYVSYMIYLRIKTWRIHPLFNIVVLAGIVLFTLCYQYLPSLMLRYQPFSVKEYCYFAGIVFSIPILFNYLKGYKFDNQVGELSYPIYICHFLVILICAELPIFMLRKGWAIAIITIAMAYVLNKLIALPVEKLRQSRLKTIKPAL